MKRLLTTLGVLFAAALVACSGSDSPPDATGPLPVDAAVLAQVPAPLAPQSAQAPGTFVGEVGPKAEAYIGFVVQGDYALVYLCDGLDGEWLGAPIRNGEIHVVSIAGTVFSATVKEDAIEGVVKAPSWSTRAFRAEPPSAGHGIFVGADPTLPDYTRRWLVLPSGVRGVSKIKASSTLVNVGAVNGVATGAGARPAKAPVVTAETVGVVVKPPVNPTPVPQPPAPAPSLPSLPPIPQAEVNATGIPWDTFRPGDCFRNRRSATDTCLDPAEWPPLCRSLSPDRVVCPNSNHVTANLPPVTQAEIDASGVAWTSFGPGECPRIRRGPNDFCLAASDWSPLCHSLSINRIVCANAPYRTASLVPITQAEVDASGVKWSTFGPGECNRIQRGPDDYCLAPSDWPPLCRSLAVDRIVCAEAQYRTASLAPVTQAEIDASGVSWASFRPGECYQSRRGPDDMCLQASDWPAECRSLSLDRIVCPDAPSMTAKLPPISQAEIDASGMTWLSFRPGNCYSLSQGRNASCLDASDWPAQCRSLSAQRIVCPDPLFQEPTPPSIAGGKQLDCGALEALLISLLKTADLKDKAVQKEVAALQSLQKSNGCIK